jgi:hemerythrin-like domain-containing protein
MTPIEQLVHEHQVILLVLDGVQTEVDYIRSTGKVRGEKIEQMLDFFRTFADKCHHAKEEKLLFQRMSDKGMPTESGPISVMLHEHDLGRAYLSAVEEALPDAEQGDDSAVEVVADSLQGYANLLRNHITKEDDILYPIANRMFTPEELKDLSDDMDRVESEEMGEGTHEKYHEMAHKLAA